MMVLLIELYLFMPLSVILTKFQDHSNIERFKWKFYVCVGETFQARARSQDSDVFQKAI